MSYVIPIKSDTLKYISERESQNISQCYIITYFQKESQKVLCDIEMAFVYSIKNKYVSKKGRTGVIPY